VDIFTREDRIPEALAVLKKAVSLTNTLLPNELDQNARTIKGKLAFLEGNLEQALEVYEAELEHLRHRSGSLDFADALSSVGTIYERMGDFERSLSLYQESFDIAKTLEARHVQVGTACGILMAHMRLGHSENGIQLGEEMLSLGWYRDSDSLRNNLVAAYNFLGHHDEVMRHSEIMAQESPDPRFRAAAWSRMAKIYPTSERQKIEKALENALEILELVFDHAAVAHLETICNVLKHFNTSSVSMFKWFHKIYESDSSKHLPLEPPFETVLKRPISILISCQNLELQKPKKSGARVLCCGLALKHRS
jgi:tetratricopeptide (TPR) repeat protein